MARRLDGQGLAPPRRYPHVEVARVGSDAFHGTRLTPEAAAHDAHARPIVIHHLRDVARADVLVARIGHLERSGEVRPQLEPVHPAALVALRHLLMKDAATRRHPLHVSDAE